MHLLKIIVSWFAKYSHLNLGKLILEKTFVIRVEVRYSSKKRAQREKNACSKEKYRITIIFHDKTKLIQSRYAAIILKYLIGDFVFLVVSDKFLSI